MGPCWYRALDLSPGWEVLGGLLWNPAHSTKYYECHVTSKPAENSNEFIGGKLTTTAGKQALTGLRKRSESGRFADDFRH